MNVGVADLVKYIPLTTVIVFWITIITTELEAKFVMFQELPVAAFHTFLYQVNLTACQRGRSETWQRFNDTSSDCYVILYVGLHVDISDQFAVAVVEAEISRVTNLMQHAANDCSDVA